MAIQQTISEEKSSNRGMGICGINTNTTNQQKEKLKQGKLEWMDDSMWDAGSRLKSENNRSEAEDRIVFELYGLQGTVVMGVRVRTLWHVMRLSKKKQKKLGVYMRGIGMVHGVRKTELKGKIPILFGRCGLQATVVMGRPGMDSMAYTQLPAKKKQGRRMKIRNKHDYDESTKDKRCSGQIQLGYVGCEVSANMLLWGVLGYRLWHVHKEEWNRTYGSWDVRLKPHPVRGSLGVYRL